MIFRPLSFVKTMKYSFPEFQTVKLTEILPDVLWFFFSNLWQFWFILCLYTLHYLTDGRVSLLSFFPFGWRHLAQNLNHAEVQFQFLLARFVLFVLNIHLTPYGEFSLSIISSSSSHTLAYEIVLYSLESESLSISPGTQGQWLKVSTALFNLPVLYLISKSNSSSWLSHLIWATPSLPSLTYANQLLSDQLACTSKFFSIH